MRKSYKCTAVFCYMGIAAVSLLFMVIYGTTNGFWYDEFAQIIYSGPPNTLLDTLKIADPTPPLFSLAANLWMRVAPMEERWLLLLPQLAMSVAVVLMGLWCQKFYGMSGGILGASLLAFSQMVVEQCGFEFRGYGFYLLFATLVFLLHGERKPWAYTLSLIGLAYCHIFGAAICAFLGVWDALQVLQKKRSWKEFLPYMLAGLVFLPWGLYFFAQAGTGVLSASGDWMRKPTLWDVVKLITFLCGNHIVVCLLFVTGCLLAVWELIAQRKSRDELESCIPLLVGVLLIFSVFLYGILRGEHASLWVKRYFTGLFPCAVFLAVRGGAELLRRRKWKKPVALTLVLLTILPVWGLRIIRNEAPFGIYHHREVAAVLQEEKAVEHPQTVLLSSLGQYGRGFTALYFPSPPPEGWVQDTTNTNPETLESVTTLYVDTGFGELSRELSDYIETNYQCTEQWPSIALKRYDRN